MNPPTVDPVRSARNRAAKITLGVNDLATTHPLLIRELVEPHLGATVGRGTTLDCRWWCGGTSERPHGYFEWNSPPYARVAGAGCPACSGKAVVVGFNDLWTTAPSVAQMLANPEDGYRYTKGSNKQVDWECNGCRFNHPAYSWRSVIVKQKVGICPVGRGKVVIPGVNDIATMKPEIAVQLVDQSLATRITAGSNTVCDWHCEGTDLRPHPRYEWSQKPNARRHARCGVCANKVILVGYNDLATVNAEAAGHLVDPAVATLTTASSSLVCDWWCEGIEGRKHPRFVYGQTVNTYVSSNGCGVCYNKIVLPGFNDLETTNPRLASQLVDTGAGRRVTGNSGATLWWWCQGTDDVRHEYYEWESTANNRANGNGCPTCAKYGYDPLGDGWVYRINFRDDGRAAVVFGKSTDIERRIKKYQSSLIGISAIERYRVGLGVDASDFECRVIALTKKHGLSSCWDNGARASGLTESFYLDEASPSFCAEFDALFGDALGAQEALGALSRESAA